MKNLRRFTLVLAFSVTAVSSCFSQNDTTEYLFRKAEYSYMNYGIGYTPIFFASGQVAHGVSLNMGCVFNHRMAIGLDFDMWAKSMPYSISEFPYATMYMASSLCVEPLIRSKKVINFSVPIKIGYGSAQVHEIYPQNYYQLSTHRFAVVQPGVMVWINLLKSVSIGAGAQYRMALNGSNRTFDLLSGFSGFAVFRFKFYTKEYMAKAMERQKQYMEMQK